MTRAQTIDCFGGYAYLGIGDDGLLYAYGKYSLHSVESVTTIATGKTETTDNGVGEVSFLLDKDTFYLAMTVYEKDEATGKYTVKNEDESMMKSGSIDDFIAEQDGWLQTAAQLILRNTENSSALSTPTCARLRKRWRRRSGWTRKKRRSSYFR